MKRFVISTNKDSAIINFSCEWFEVVINSRYILDLFLSVIKVILQTVDIVKGLPKVKFD